MKKLLNFTTFMLMWCILHTSVAMGADLTVKADVLNSNTPSRTKIDVKKDLDLQTTGGLYLPSGTTAQQPVPYKDGMFRYNSTEGTAELFANGLWGPVGGSTSIADWNAGNDYETGDFVIHSLKLYRALLDHTASGSFPTDLANGDWEEISAGITAIGSIADNRIARFDGTTGELIQSSTAVLDDSGNLSGINNIGVAGNASVAGTTTLNTSLTGVVKAVSGLLSASAVDLSLDVVGTLPIANGGTGATSKSWVDLTTNQGAIAGNKAFTGNLSTSGTMLASNLSGTNTGDLTTSGWSGPTTTTNKLKAPFRQMTPSATGEVAIETGNNNELINPRFEAATYNDGWTCSLGTMTQAVGPGGSKAMQVVSTGAGFRCRQTFTSTAELKGTLARFYARIKTAAPDVKVCGLDGGILTANEVGCVTVNPTNAGKVFDDPSGFFRYGDSLYGIVIYTTNTLTFPTIIDDTLMGAAGLTTTTIQGDTVYSAQVNGSSIANSNKPFLSSCSGTTQVICNFISGMFTVEPNCTAIITDSSQAYAVRVNSVNTSLVAIDLFNTTTGVGVSGINFTLICQKSGADYANSSSSGILSGNADYGFTSCTLPLTNAGNATQALQCKKSGDTMIIRGRVTIGSTLPTGAILLTLPNSLVANTPTPGSGFLGTVTAVTNSPFFPIGTASLQSTTTFGILNVGTSSLWNATTPATWVAGHSFDLNNIMIPIVGWTQSPLAIIPLAGTATVPGYSGQVDDLVFGFGDTSSTPCTTGTCAYLRQAGNGIVKVDFAGTGAYTINTRRSYNLIFCTGSLTGTSYTIGFQGTGVGPGNSFTIQTGGGGVNINSWGTLFCKGYY